MQLRGPITASGPVEHRDLDGVQRWTTCYHDLSVIYDPDRLDRVLNQAS